jgi:hypothetical protein
MIYKVGFFIFSLLAFFHYYPFVPSSSFFIVLLFGDNSAAADISVFLKCPRFIPGRRMTPPPVIQPQHGLTGSRRNTAV